MLSYRLKVAIYDAKCRALRMQRSFGRLVHQEKKGQYLFVLSPLYCGSTLLHQILSTSPSVSPNNIFGTREGLGLPEVRRLIDYREEWNEAYPHPWEEIRQIWHSYWASHKSLLLDKSPTNVLRAKEIQRHFLPVQFICVTRHPLAHCESLIRRNKMTADEAAQLSLKCLSHQRMNLEDLGEVMALRYEDLVGDPPAARESLLKFVPKLGDIDITRSFNSNNHTGKALAITDLNKAKIARLSAAQMDSIEKRFDGHEDLLSFFGYSLEI